MKLNSCVDRIQEFDDHVKVRCVDGTEYKVYLSLIKTGSYTPLHLSSPWPVLSGIRTFCKQIQVVENKLELVWFCYSLFICLIQRILGVLNNALLRKKSENTAVL